MGEHTPDQIKAKARKLSKNNGFDLLPDCQRFTFLGNLKMFEKIHA
jgi:hypothetical protein